MRNEQLLDHNSNHRFGKQKNNIPNFANRFEDSIKLPEVLFLT